MNAFVLGSMWEILLTGAGIAALAAGAAGYLWFTRTQRAALASPKRLFRELCKAHRLSWREIGLLRRLAREQQLDQAGRLFLESSRFDIGKPADLGCTPQQLQKLKRRLFGELAEPSPEAGR